MIAESAEMSGKRRQAFREMVRSRRTIPLDKYLGMTHPVFSGLAAIAALARRA